jgi:hypothetical protein|tara:strand:+ start:446 stop:970 length:525 start_codon:yes stop_codon:yes gene_type:complete
MKLVIQTQHKENYAAHNEDYVHGVSEPYWKFKGGSTYIVPSYKFSSAEATQNTVDNLEAMLCFSNECAEESVSAWFIKEDSSRVCEDWETPTIVMPCLHGWRAMRTTDNRERGSSILTLAIYMKREILERVETWDLTENGDIYNYKVEFLMEDGDFCIGQEELTSWFESKSAAA